MVFTGLSVTLALRLDCASWSSMYSKMAGLLCHLCLRTSSSIESRWPVYVDAVETNADAYSKVGSRILAVSS